MKNFFLAIVSFFISITVFAQSTNYVVSGKVVDAVTKAPLQAASVFAQNTTIGTASDAEGNFKLVLPNGGYDVVASFTGYETGARRVTTADADNKNIVIELKQKEKELADVVVKASNEVKDGWEKYGDFFLENFIGKTANSKQCTIKNKDVLKFYFYKRSNRLKVLATAPVEIANEALGYNIKYTLDSFSHLYNTQTSVFSGYPLFEEMQPSSDAQRMQWDSNRAVAYRGSILHFMRSLYRKQLKEEGFEIQFIAKVNDKEVPVPLKDFYGAMNYDKDDSTNTVEIMPNQSQVAVIYKNEVPDAAYLAANPDEPSKFQLSVVNFLPKESIVIEQNGYYFEQTDITINAYWEWEKAGDMLPYDYKVQ